MQDLVSLAILAAAFMLFYVCVSGWWYSFNRLSSGQRILPLESGPTVSWGFFDLFLAVALLIVFTGILLFLSMKFLGIIGLTKETLDSSDIFLINIWIDVLAKLSVFIILALSIYSRVGEGAIFGKSIETIFRDIRLGFIAFAMAVFPVLIIQLILTQFWEYDHTLINKFQNSPTVALAIPVFLAAVICAPLFEEFAMRLLFQGWLGDFISGRLDGGEVLWGKWKQTDEPRPATFEVDPNASPEELFSSNEYLVPTINTDSNSSSESDNPYQSPQTETYVSNDPRLFLDSAESSPILSRWWPIPIFVSSLLFASLHIGQGPAPIPLFFLALVLGYLYQRTRRMTACLVVHFLLNAQSMCLLMLQILFPE